MERRGRELERERREISAQIEALQSQLAGEVAEEALLKREGYGARGSTYIRLSCHGYKPENRSHAD
jgi:hypothetical protein